MKLKMKPIRKYAVVLKDKSQAARLRGLAHAAELESLGLEQSKGEK